MHAVRKSYKLGIACVATSMTRQSLALQSIVSFIVGIGAVAECTHLALYVLHSLTGMIQPESHFFLSLLL